MSLTGFSFQDILGKIISQIILRNLKPQYQNKRERHGIGKENSTATFVL